MNYTVYSLSDTGRVRQLNEDSLRVERPSDPSIAGKWGDLYVVADGMGGHESGEVASKIAIETIAQVYYRANGMPTDEALAYAIEQANAEIFRRAQEEDRHGMGTTVVAAARIGNKIFLAHVGDSRIYLIRDGKIKALTQDHSMVAEQVAAGLLTPEEAERHPYRNVISRAVGTAPQVEVEISQSSPLELREGDVVLLCSDGLTEHVKAPQIRQIVGNRAAESAAHALIQAANNGGGSDNISVIILRVGEVRSDTATTAVMPVGDAITEPNPVLDPPEAVAARLATASAPPTKGGGGWGWGRLILLGIIIGLIISGGYFALNPSMFSPPVVATVTPEVTVEPTVSTAPLPTSTQRPAPSPTTPPATPEGNPTLAPLPTLPQPAN
jgi:serine/threonine protein phosphatase PrpC